jgi:hypothetical protein
MKVYDLDKTALWISNKILFVRDFFLCALQKLSVRQQQFVAMFCCLVFALCSTAIIINLFQK